MRARRSASGDGESPFASSLFRMKRSIGVRIQSRLRTAGTVRPPDRLKRPPIAAGPARRGDLKRIDRIGAPARARGEPRSKHCLFTLSERRLRAASRPTTLAPRAGSPRACPARSPCRSCRRRAPCFFAKGRAFPWDPPPSDSPGTVWRSSGATVAVEVTAIAARDHGQTHRGDDRKHGQANHYRKPHVAPHPSRLGSRPVRTALLYLDLAAAASSACRLFSAAETITVSDVGIDVDTAAETTARAPFRPSTRLQSSFSLTILFLGKRIA